jgi:hypothetical protein
MICGEGLMMTDIDRNMGHYKEIKNCISRRSSVCLYNWLNGPPQRSNTGFLSWHFASRKFTLRYASVPQLVFKLDGRTARSETSPSVRQQYYTDQAAGTTMNKYHAVKTSPSVDRRITWRSVFTSQTAPLLLREICCVVEGIRVRSATRDGRSWDQMPAGRVGCPCPSSLLSNRYLVFTWGKSAGSGAYCPILQPEWLAAISPPP